MLDFQQFRDSSFYSVGCQRYNTATKKMYATPICMVATQPLLPLTESEITVTDGLCKEADDLYRDVWNELGLIHMRTCLDMPGYLPDEFRKIIGRQWLEVTSITNQITQKPLASYLLVQHSCHHVPVHLHRNIKHTLTFSYPFEEDSGVDFNNSYLLVIKDGQRKKISIPDSENVYFILGDEPHGAHSNQSRFYWVHDYAEKFTLPGITNFKHIEI